MFNNWWNMARESKAPSAPKETIPRSCNLCGAFIKEDEIYWLGFDENDIFAACCDRHDCKMWLVRRVKRRRP